MQGIYVKGKSADSLLGQLGYILEETPAQPSAKDLQADVQAADSAAEQQPGTGNAGMAVDQRTTAFQYVYVFRILIASRK